MTVKYRKDFLGIARRVALWVLWGQLDARLAR